MRESKTRRMSSNMRRGERERKYKKRFLMWDTQKRCRVDDDARDEQMTFVSSRRDGKTKDDRDA
jgi:hypothetical protein